jgi:hypothetical protein
VRLSGAPLELGRLSGEPIAEAVVNVGAIPTPSGPELWRLHAEADAGGVPRTIDRWLCRQDGALVVHASAGPSLAVHTETGVVTIEAGPDILTRQLVASFAVPLILNGHDALVLHAATLAKDGRALVVCGPTGAGKSSVLVRMVDAGWQPLTEDVCAIDLRDDVPAAWPGPPWVRRAYGEPGPAGAGLRFNTPDKAAWDLAPWQGTGPVPVAQLVFLESPGGDTPRRERLAQPHAVRDLAQHAAWLRDPTEAPRRLFGLALAFTKHVRCDRLRLPRRTSWLDELPDVLDSGF